jgi:hypothetical protein
MQCANVSSLGVFEAPVVVPPCGSPPEPHPAIASAIVKPRTADNVVGLGRAGRPASLGFVLATAGKMLVAQLQPRYSGCDYNCG